MASAAQAGTVGATGAAEVRTDVRVLPRSEPIDVERTCESSAKISLGAMHPMSALIATTSCLNRSRMRDELKNRTIRKHIQINYAVVLTGCAHCDSAATSGQNSGK